MTDLILLIVYFIEIILFLGYSIITYIHFVKRSKDLDHIDDKMRNIGRVFAWGGAIGAMLVNSGLRNNYNLGSVLMCVSLIFCSLGLRLYILSFRVKEENKDTFYYGWDQWLEKMYRKYLEPLWPKK